VRPDFATVFLPPASFIPNTAGEVVLRPILPLGRREGRLVRVRSVALRVARGSDRVESVTLIRPSTGWVLPYVETLHPNGVRRYSPAEGQPLVVVEEVEVKVKVREGAGPVAIQGTVNVERHNVEEVSNA
jgi:hypothetical protein